jgi:hypothetical protein
LINGAGIIRPPLLDRARIFVPNWKSILSHLFDFIINYLNIAAQQILNTFSLNKAVLHTHRGMIFMRLDRIAIFLGCFLTAGAVVATAPAAAQTPYDGLWNVTVVTKTGSCERSARSTLTVSDGRVSAAGAEVSGSIGREGLVRVSINGAYASGQLSGNTGSGKWNGASGGIPCSGRWEASRQ